MNVDNTFCLKSAVLRSVWKTAKLPIGFIKVLSIAGIRRVTRSDYDPVRLHKNDSVIIYEWMIVCCMRSHLNEHFFNTNVIINVCFRYIDPLISYFHSFNVLSSV